jgi:hypothetical protein
MTTPAPITVASLADLLSQWPRHGATGAPTTVLLGDRFPDAAIGPLPAVAAGAIELDDGGHQHLVLFPPQRQIPAGSTADHADALDLAAAALSYHLTTPIHAYEPEKAMELAARAVTAIDTIKRLERRLSL